MIGGNRERLYGRHPIHEALIAGRRRIECIYIAEGSVRQGILEQILHKAKKAEVRVDFVPKDSLDSITEHHQGVVAEVGSYPYVDLEDILKRLNTGGEAGLVLLLDVLQDPQNLGTLLRTAEAVGVQGVVLPYKRSAGVTPAVVRSSAGASEHLWITQGNLARVIEKLKEVGLWIVGLDITSEAQSMDMVDLSGPMGLVVGGEGEGLRRLVRESCDFLLKLPMKGKVASLNAAVAGSVALYAIWQARGFNSGPTTKET